VKVRQHGPQHLHNSFDILGPAGWKWIARIVSDVIWRHDLISNLESPAAPEFLAPPPHDAFVLFLDRGGDRRRLCMKVGNG